VELPGDLDGPGAAGDQARDLLLAIGEVVGINDDRSDLAPPVLNARSIAPDVFRSRAATYRPVAGSQTSTFPLLLGAAGACM
jgi:hypothetical protein